MCRKIVEENCHLCAITQALNYVSGHQDHVIFVMGKSYEKHALIVEF